MGFVCSHCGKTHEGLAAKVYFKPDPWLGLTDDERAIGKCSDDLCRTPDGQYFVRSVLELPLIGGPEPTFEFGVWGSLSEANFRRYVDSFDDLDQSKLGLMFSYLSNEVRGYPNSFALPANLQTRDNRQRPFMLLEPTDHPLVIAQRDGIAFEKVLEIIH
jgi:hypothetical protein